MSESRKQLERAFKLIKKDKTDEALSILRPILAEEPENAHAWWLLAYAETDPVEVRRALLTMLRLDPNYSNAPKARDMLVKLNQEYPPSSEEIAMFPELAPEEDELLLDVFEPVSSFAEADTFAQEDIFAPVDLPEEGANFFANDPFGELETDPFAADQTQANVKAEKKSRRGQPVTELQFEEVLDDETLAAREEQAGRRRGRGRRIRLMLFALVVLAAAVGVIVLVLQQDEDETTTAADPGDLKLVEIDSPTVTNVVQTAGTQLTSWLPGNNEIVLAESELGKTFYVRICGQVDPTLPDGINAGMQLASQQAAQLEGEVDAVGVSVESCINEKHDTLYRAVVSTEDAVRYQSGELSWAEYQRRWTKA